MKLRAATLHENVFIEGVGDVNKVLSTRPSPATKAVEEMSLEDGIVTVVFKDKVGKAIKTLMPVTAFKVLIPE